jgi:uroporphyrinogen-III synthase
MPLDGLTVAITSSRRAGELARIVENLGGRPYIAPTIGIEADLENPKEDVLKFLDHVIAGNVDYIVFMTGPGIFSLFSVATKLGLEDKLIHSLSNATIIARSIKPKMVLKKYGVEVNLIPEENTAQGVLRLLLAKGVVGKKIAILWHGDYPDQLRETLYKARVLTVIEASTYRYSVDLKKDGASILESMGYDYVAPNERRVVQLIDKIIAGKINSITFTSPPSVHDLFKIAEVNNKSQELKSSLNANVLVVAVGPSTKNAIEEHCITVHVMPRIFKMGSMIKALDEYVTKRNQTNSENSNLMIR